MLIDCPHCSAGYDLDVAELADGGLIRCAHCHAMWNPDPFSAQAKPSPRRRGIVLEAEPRARTEDRDLIDCDVFYEEITRPIPQADDTLKVMPEVFRYAPEAAEENDASPPNAGEESLRDALLRTAAEAPADAPAAILKPQGVAEAEIVVSPDRARQSELELGEAEEPAAKSHHDGGNAFSHPVPANSSGETFEELEAFARSLPDAHGKEPVAPLPLKLIKNDALPAAKRKSRARWPYAAAGLAAAIAGLLVWRVEVVRAAPQTAAIYAALRLPVNVRGLNFADVRTTQEKLDGVEVLVVTGSIANPTRKPMDVPGVRLALLDAGGTEVFTWKAAAGKTSLAPGETLPFRSRLASPPASAQDIQVRFVSRRDTATP